MSDRLAVAKDLLMYTKHYMSGDDFKNEYSELRNSVKPVTPTGNPVRTKTAVEKELMADTETSIKDMEANMKSFEGDMKKIMQESLDVLKVNLKEYQNINNPLFDMYIAGDSMNNVQANASYKADLDRWKEEYPEDNRQIIKVRLEEFLEATAGVDFSAALKDQYGKKVFVNATYERKPAQWKQAFRAGREITDYARSFATQWLRELK